MSLMNAFIQNLGPYVRFDDLHLGVYEQHVEGRILRFWESRNEIRNESDRDASRFI